MKKTSLFLLISLMILLMVALTACGGSDDTVTDNSGNEAGNNDTATDTEEETGEETPDETDAADSSITLDDLSGAQEGIKSYHFIQSVEANGLNYSVEVYFKDNKMKAISQLPDGSESYAYIDYASGEMITYTPSLEAQAIKMPIDANSEELPSNPLEEDYTVDYDITSEENIDGYNCRVLQSLDGSMKMWIIEEYGFPVRIEMVDNHSGATFVTEYKELSFNDVTDEDVSVPDDLDILDMNDLGFVQ